MTASYEADIGADSERPKTAEDFTNFSFAVDWMIYYALFAIPTYIVCWDLQQGWIKSANHYLPIAYENAFDYYRRSVSFLRFVFDYSSH